MVWNVCLRAWRPSRAFRKRSDNCQELQNLGVGFLCRFFCCILLAFVWGRICLQGLLPHLLAKYWGRIFVHDLLLHVLQFVWARFFCKVFCRIHLPNLGRIFVQGLMLHVLVVSRGRILGKVFCCISLQQFEVGFLCRVSHCIFNDFFLGMG